mgnify:CR=1 FL=1
MPDRIDEFESVFRSADKPLFHLAPPPVRRALVLSDREPADADAFEDRVRRYVESGDPDSTLEWQSWHGDRSEEHTSELQSQADLVCRLLLEKKKNGGDSKSVRDADRLGVRLSPEEANDIANVG